jgi:hypothetical protein
VIFWRNLIVLQKRQCPASIRGDRAGRMQRGVRWAFFCSRRAHGLYRHARNRTMKVNTTNGSKRITRAKRNAEMAFKNKVSQSRKLYSRGSLMPSPSRGDRWSINGQVHMRLLDPVRVRQARPRAVKSPPMVARRGVAASRSRLVPSPLSVLRHPKDSGYSPGHAPPSIDNAAVDDRGGGCGLCFLWSTPTAAKSQTSADSQRVVHTVRVVRPRPKEWWASTQT